MVDPERLRGELVLAAVGLSNVLKSEPKFNRTVQVEADKFIPHARAELLRFLGGAQDSVEAPPAFDYDEILKLLTEPDEDSQVAALHAAIPDELVDDVIATATGIVDKLAVNLPRAVQRSVVNAKVNQPGPLALAKFKRGWAVANDPAIVLRNLLQRTITADEVDALWQFYPSIAESVIGPNGAADDAIVAMKVRRGDNWDISEADNRLLRELFRGDIINRDVAQGLAAHAAPVPGQKPQQSNKQQDKASEASQLAGQKPI